MNIEAVKKIEKVPVYLKKEVDGCLLSRIFRAIQREAEWFLEMGAFRATGDRTLLPMPSLVEKYSRGHFGQKSGKGWYDYTEK